MTKQLEDAVRKQKQSTKRHVPQIYGVLGIPINGKKTVEVPNRNAYVYVRLRNNQSEVIQAFNNQVSPAYNLPVIVERRGGRYTVIEVDTQRYENNWNSFAPFLPRHGNTHSFDVESGGGGDVVWVHSRQFMPALVFPSGSLGGPNVIVSSYTLKNDNGSWKYIGNTGTQNLTPYNPVSSTGAIMVLVYLDSSSGNPYILVGSGTVFASSLTGTSQITPYIPSISNPATQIPLAAIRLVTGTSQISWDNIYDVRQFLHNTPTGTGGGGATGTTITVWDEGIPLGTPSVLNFVGAGVTATISGSVVQVNVPGGGSTNLTGTSIGLPNAAVLTDSNGFLQAAPWLRWGTSNKQFLEFGADVAGKESNAGKIGYETFGAGYLYIVGAGTGSSDRRVQIYDKLYVSDSIEASSFNIANPAQTYNITGSPHSHAGLVVAETNTNDIYAVSNPSGTSAFVGTIATLPGGATLTYNVTSGTEGAMVPIATTQLGKMRLYNTTRGTNALISNCVTGTNTVTLTANVPAGWQVGDTITIASQTVSGGGRSWVDIEIVSGPTGKPGLFLNFVFNSATVGNALRLHPFTASFSVSKYFAMDILVASVNMYALGLYTCNSNIITLAWDGTPASILIREAGYVTL